MKLKVILLALLMAGCTSFKDMDRIVQVTGFDFTELAEKGFLISPNSYTDKYQSMGLITAQIFPAVKNIPAGGMKDINKYNIISYQGAEVLVEKMDTKAVAMELYKIATAMNGDAIVNIQIKQVEYENVDIKVPGWEITGFVIKRLK